MSYGYTTLVLHSCVWQEVHDPCSWDKLFRALSTTSGMWSVIILGLIKMLLKTVSFDHLAVYFISEEHNLKRKPNTSQIQWLRLSELVLDAKPEQTTWRLWTLLREEVEPSHSRKVGFQGASYDHQQTAGNAAIQCPRRQNYAKVYCALTVKEAIQ